MTNCDEIHLLTKFRGNFGFTYNKISDAYVFIVELPKVENEDLDPVYKIRGKILHVNLIWNTGEILPITNEEKEWLSTSFSCKHVIQVDKCGCPFSKSVRKFLDQYIRPGNNDDIEKLYSVYLESTLPGLSSVTFAKFKTYLPVDFKYSFTPIVCKYTTQFKELNSIEQQLGVMNLEKATNSPSKLLSSILQSIKVQCLIIDDVNIEKYYISTEDGICGQFILTESSSGMVFCGELSQPYSREQIRWGFSREDFLSKLKPVQKLVTTAISIALNFSFVFSAVEYDQFLTMIIALPQSLLKTKQFKITTGIGPCIPVEKYFISINDDIEGKYIVTMTTEGLIICGQLETPYTTDEIKLEFKDYDFLSRLKAPTTALPKHYLGVKFSQLEYGQFVQTICS